MLPMCRCARPYGVGVGAASIWRAPGSWSAGDARGTVAVCPAVQAVRRPRVARGAGEHVRRLSLVVAAC
eukprot:scaffold165484_cov31-Tisochrysis_lutea.AAC.1